MKSSELFDDYLQGKLNAESKQDFENRMLADSVFANAFEQHKELIEVLKLKVSRDKFKTKLKEIHSSEFGNEGTILSISNQETFARKHGRTIAVAASTALFAVFTTVAILSTGGYLLKKQSNEITELKRDVIKLQASNNGIVEGITKSNHVAYAPANIEGSAFALNNNGFILTSFHLIKNADSVFIQNNETERTAAELVMCDPKLDLAVLKINTIAITKKWDLPYSFKDKNSDIGEKVFTLGYPNNDVVYGEGSLSSLCGYMNDVNMYQVSIPINPGNSGGPLLDENCNIIGVIRGKNTFAEATGFAIKANEIIKAIKRNEGTKDIDFQKSKHASIKFLKRPEQIKKINPYVFNVLIYNKD